MASFVGSERKEIVAALLARFDSCVAEEVPHLVCLTSEAGWGKTRIVQELYGHLQRERQGEASYWPDMLVSEPDPMQARKIIYPASVSPADDAKLPWLWWGLRCEEDSSGRKVRALANDRVQLRAHLVGLIHAAELKAGDREAMLGVLGEVVGAIPGIGQAAGIALAVKSLVPQVRRRFIDALERGKRRQNAGREQRVIDIGEPGLQDIEPELELVRRFISPQLPLVLVVDDAHDADPMTVSFLRQIMRLRVPALVVATAWPSALADQIAAESEVAEEERVTFGGLFVALQTEMKDSVGRFDLQPLSTEDLSAIVSEVAPATPASGQHALVDSAGGNPLVLRLQLTSPKVTRSVVDGAITLPPNELERLPRGFETLIAERYFELPFDEQRWLAEAAEQGINFFPDFINAERAELDMDLLGGFVRLSSSGGISTGRFIERPVHRAMLAAADSEFTAAEREQWETSTLAALQAFCEAESDDTFPSSLGVLRSFCMLLVRLAETYKEKEQVNAVTIADAAIRWSFAERDSGRHSVELEAAKSAVEWSRKVVGNGRPLLRATLRLSAAYRATNAPEEAVRTAEAGLTLIERETGTLKETRSEAEILLALALHQNENLQAAREAANRALEFARHDDERIWALRALAAIEEDMGETAAARMTVTAALTCARQQQPVDVALVIELETDLMDLEPFQGSSQRWRALAELVERELGESHSLHRYCLFSLAFALINEGAMNEATRVLDDLERDFGKAGDINLLQQLVNLALHGDVDGLAIAMQDMTGATPYSKQHEIHERGVFASMFHVGLSGDVEPPSDPGTVVSATSFATLALENPDLAIVTLARRFEDDPSAFRGPDQGLIVSTAATILGDWLLNTGAPHPRSAEVVTRLRSLIDTPDFPVFWLLSWKAYEQALSILAGREPLRDETSEFPVITPRVASQRAVAYFAMGDPRRCDEELVRALSAVEELPAFAHWRMVAKACTTCDSPRAVGAWQAAIERSDASPGDILVAKLGLGSALAGQNRSSEARTVLHGALESLRSTLGEDHVMTRNAKRDLASTLERLDEVADARRLRYEVMISRRKELGPEELITIDAEEELAVTCHLLKEYTTARELEEHVLEVRRHELGENDPSTVRAKRNLVAALVELSELDRARTLQEEILAIERVEPGPDDLKTLDSEAVLGVTCFRQGDYTTAKELEEHVFEVRRRELGEDDPRTLQAKRNLDEVLTALKGSRRKHKLTWHTPTGGLRAANSQTHIGAVRWIFG